MGIVVFQIYYQNSNRQLTKRLIPDVTFDPIQTINTFKWTCGNCFSSPSHLYLVDGGLVLLLSGLEQRLGVFNHLLDGLIWLQLDTASGREEKKKKKDLHDKTETNISHQYFMNVSERFEEELLSLKSISVKYVTSNRSNKAFMHHLGKIKVNFGKMLG